MIVTLNNNNSDKYLNLFTEAYEYLKELDNGYVDLDKERFSSLAEYYSHMADFFENQKYKYVMLPLDEDPFLIDLNTRNITVPTSFNKCASVQKDQLAETIIFIVDRYFDYMDLANTEIYVQWTIPENKKLGIEEYNGATRIEMIDLETEPGKLKFAWPLNDKITAVPGVVKFSVRFFRVDDSTPNKLLYSLNTLESQIIIKEALQPDLNKEHQIESPVSDESFKKAILNSIYSNEGVVPPVQPVYFSPGSNITADTMIEVGDLKIVSLQDDTITLKVQAVVADAGEITYKWYYQDANGEYYDCENYPVFDSDGIPTGETTTFGTVQDVYSLIDPAPQERVTNERYYMQIEGSRAYKLYTGNIPTDGIPLYERYSTFVVPESGNITGYYQAAAWNNIKLQNGKTLTTLYPTRSDACLLPGPAVIVFKENGNLPNGSILNLVDEDENRYNTTLTVDTIPDDYQPKVKYEWRMSNTSKEQVLDDSAEILQTTDIPSLSVSEPGWYAVNIVAELNREEKTKLSEICKVTHKPQPALVDPQKHMMANITETPVTFTVNAHINNPDSINDELLSDEFTYIWQIMLPDLEDFINITDSMAGIDGLGTKSLTVNSKLKASSANLRCLVINNLNGAKTVFDHSGTLDPKKGVLYGDFKPEAPYIYEDDTDNYVFTVINF